MVVYASHTNPTLSSAPRLLCYTISAVLASVKRLTDCNAGKKSGFHCV